MTDDKIRTIISALKDKAIEDDDALKAVLHLYSPEYETIHYIYRYKGYFDNALHYDALFVSGGYVGDRSFSLTLKDNDVELELLEEDGLLGKRRNEISWILELNEISTRIDNLRFALKEGGVIHGNFTYKL